jgi:hypothetical protein
MEAIEATGGDEEVIGEQPTLPREWTSPGQVLLPQPNPDDPIPIPLRAYLKAPLVVRVTFNAGG